MGAWLAELGARRLPTESSATVADPVEASGDQLSARLGQRFALGPPGRGPVANVRDVVVCRSTETDVSPEEFDQHPPVAFPFSGREGDVRPVELGRGVRLDRLPHDEAELVMNACSRRGHYFVPVRQYGQMYSLVRDVDPAEADAALTWDPDSALRDVLMISRLVRDNNYSAEYAARITNYEHGEQMVMYWPVPNIYVYRLRRDRDWLDEGEAIELRDLLAAFWTVQESLPARIRRTLWRTEYAGWSAWADAMLPTLVGGLEALLKTERGRATKQFMTRVPLLAEELGIEGLFPTTCERLYDARSEWVHGAHVRLFTGNEEIDEALGVGGQTQEDKDALADIARLQDVLRAALRRALENEGFRQVFTDDDAIRERWPLEPDAPRAAQPRRKRGWWRRLLRR
jgi:hypothetical protein